jgi:hypothetical protein
MSRSAAGARTTRRTAVEWNAQPSTADRERVSALLAHEPTADEAVAIPTLNNPRLQTSRAIFGRRRRK